MNSLYSVRKKREFRIFLGTIVCVLFIVSSFFYFFPEEEKYHYYLAQWEWNADDPENPRWEVPAMIGSLIDMRTWEQAASPGFSVGYAFVAVDSSSRPKGMKIAESLDEKVRDSVKRELEKILGLSPGRIRADTTREIIYELVTDHADFTNQTRWSGVLPNESKLVQVYLGGKKIASKPFAFDGSLYANKVLERYRIVYEKIWEAEQRGEVEKDHHRMYLTVLMKKFDTQDYEQFIFAHLPKETPLPLASTIGDTFVEGSNTALGSHTATGTNGGHTYTEYVNAGGGEITVIAADDAISSTGNITAYFVSADLDGDDHYAQLDITDIGSGGTRRVIGVLTRTSTDANSESSFRFEAGVFDGSNELYIEKVTSGTASTVASKTSGVSLSNGQVLKGESNGSTHTLYIDDTSQLTYSEDVFGGNLRTGIYGRDNSSATVRSDNFQAADLAAAARTASVQISSIGVKDVSATTAKISWYTFPPTNNTKLVGEPVPEYAGDSSKIKIWHEALLSKLSPSTLYSYTIQAGLPSRGFSSSAYFSFQTNPAPVSSETGAGQALPEQIDPLPEEANLESLRQQVTELQLRVVELANTLIQLLRVRLAAFGG